MGSPLFALSTNKGEPMKTDPQKANRQKIFVIFWCLVLRMGRGDLNSRENADKMNKRSPRTYQP